MSYEFDEDTTVTALGGGAYDAVVADRWSIGDKPNGGYLLALVLRAMCDDAPQPDPLTVTGHFLRPPRPGPAQIEVERVRAGRTTATLMARLVQDGAEILRVIGAFGSIGGESVEKIAAAPPDLPPPDETASTARDDAPPSSIVHRFDYSGPPGLPGWLHGKPTGEARNEAWIRFADGREPDVLSLALIADAFPPAVFELGIFSWSPTLELTVHFRERPAPGWLAARITSRFVFAGYAEEDVELYDSRGRPVALSRQLLRLGR